MPYFVAYILISSTFPEILVKLLIYGPSSHAKHKLAYTVQATFCFCRHLRWAFDTFVNSSLKTIKFSHLHLILLILLYLLSRCFYCNFLIFSNGKYSGKLLLWNGYESFILCVLIKEISLLFNTNLTYK